jgi:serine/threonine-protein kinase HipA
MLERIGGECAGAVTFVEQGQALPERNYSYRELSEEELAAILKELHKRPLLAGEEGIRLSLAGAQDKVAVRIEASEASLPVGGAPSSHVLKPAVGPKRCAPSDLFSEERQSRNGRPGLPQSPFG